MKAIECEQDTLVIRGPLTQQQVPAIWRDKSKWLAPEIRKLELSALTDLDSAGLAMLLEVEASVATHGYKLDWHGRPAKLDSLMALYNLHLKQDRLV